MDAGQARTSSPAPVPASGQVVRPSDLVIGKVTMANLQARFVVLNFGFGLMPPLDQRLDVYRDGLKTGEVKVCGPQRDDNVVADIVEGNCQIGDEVRSR